MRVVWTPEADADLDVIKEFVGRVSEGGATRLTERITRRTHQLADYPWSGRMVPEYQVELLRELIEDDYRVVYEVFPDRVEIVGVSHGHRRFVTEE